MNHSMPGLVKMKRRKPQDSVKLTQLKSCYEGDVFPPSQGLSRGSLQVKYSESPVPYC